MQSWIQRQRLLQHVANRQPTQRHDSSKKQRENDDAEHSSAQENSSRQGSSEETDDYHEVKPIGKSDPASAQNWPNSLRIRTTLIVWLLVFTEGWVSTCDGNSVKAAAAAFHVSETAETCATGLFLIGLSTGSLIAGPLSETYGRNPVYLCSTFAFLCFTLGAALAPNFGAQITFRFLGGVFSSPTLSIYGGTLADLFSTRERSYVWPYFALSPLLGPVLSPLAGSWISGHISFRWVYWIGLAFSGAAFLIALFFLPETFAPVLLEWKARALRLHTHDNDFKSPTEGQADLATRLGENLKRPLVFWTQEPIVICLGAYLCLIYIVNFTFLDGFEFIFVDTYGLSSGIAGLGFVAITVGALIQTALNPLFWKLHKHFLKPGTHSGIKDVEKVDEADDDDIGPPELRLFGAMCASPFFALSLFWLGWTNYPSISPWSAYLACCMFGYSLAAIFISSYAYIIDAYGSYASSALGSITLARYLASGGMVIASRPMYEGIGVHWTLTLLGILGVILVPVPFVLYRYGRLIIAKSKFAE